MAGDPTRRPSNERVRVAGVTAMIWIECRSCFGDGWSWPHRGRPTRKITCQSCGGIGRRQIPALQRMPNDRVLAGPSAAGQSETTIQNGGE